jgi:iron donor protein CyaY
MTAFDRKMRQFAKFERGADAGSALMKEQREFKHHADEAMARLYSALCDAADDYPFDPEMEAGALKIEFDDPPAKFVVSPNSAVEQIWVSALSKSFKLDWDPVEGSFIHSESGLTLLEMLSAHISKQIGEEVSL